MIQKEPYKAVDHPKFEPQKQALEVLKAKGEFDRPPYHTNHYLLYGFECEPDSVNSVNTLSYLTALGFDRNSMKQTRDGKRLAAYMQSKFEPNKAGTRYCDFCGSEIYGVEYETLADGRDRCMSCGRTAIKTEGEFREIFNDVKRNMEAFFGITIDTGIRVEMVNAKTLHKRLGESYIPTPRQDGRTLGVAIPDKGQYKLYVENGSPRIPSMLTMAHELTHIWQFLNWDDKAIRKKYGKQMRLEIYEGMAKWAEIQYAYLINETAAAKREEIITSFRSDVYGYGFLRYHANYPFSYGTVITKDTPFDHIDTPLDPEFLGPMQINLPLPGTEDLMGISETEDSDLEPPASGDVDPIEGAKERTPGQVRSFAYELLSEPEKAVYDALVQTITDFGTEYVITEEGISSEQLFQISDFIQRDHPELFWYQFGMTVQTDSATGAVQKVLLTYKLSPEEAQKRQKEIDTATEAFLGAITTDMSDYEVALRVYKNIIEIVDYDTIGLERQKKDLSSCGEPDDLRSIYGVFVKKKAVCAGYAKAMQYLLNAFGIECTYVVSDTHAWNMVKLEGDWYHLDVTWGDGSNTQADKNVTDRVSYDYFCFTTEELNRLDSHQPTSDVPLPDCTATSCNFYYRHGLMFDRYDEGRIQKIIEANIAAEYKEISLKCADKQLFELFRKELIDNGKFVKFCQVAGINANKKVPGSFQYISNDKMYTLRFIL